MENKFRLMSLINSAIERFTYISLVFKTFSLVTLLLYAYSGQEFNIMYLVFTFILIIFFMLYDNYIDLHKLRYMELFKDISKLETCRGIKLESLFKDFSKLSIFEHIWYKPEWFHTVCLLCLCIIAYVHS